MLRFGDRRGDDVPRPIAARLRNPGRSVTALREHDPHHLGSAA